MFANSQPSFDHYNNFLTVGQNNLWNKIPINTDKKDIFFGFGNSLYSKVQQEDAQTLQSQFCGFKAPI